MVGRRRWSTPFLAVSLLTQVAWHLPTSQHHRHHGRRSLGTGDQRVRPTLIRTPNIDRLADEGILFSSSFVTNSICAPSRAVLLTGKYSHRNGLRDNRDEFDGSQMTFPKLLQQAGLRDGADRQVASQDRTDGLRPLAGA